MTKLNIKGNTTEYQTSIRNEQKRFYSSLYDKKKRLFNNNISKLNDLDKNKCEGKLTEYECVIALKQMNNSKSPGSDGITTEFYKLFWQDIKLY